MGEDLFSWERICLFGRGFIYLGEDLFIWERIYLNSGEDLYVGEDLFIWERIYLVGSGFEFGIRDRSGYRSHIYI